MQGQAHISFHLHSFHKLHEKKGIHLLSCIQMAGVMAGDHYSCTHLAISTRASGSTPSTVSRPSDLLVKESSFSYCSAIPFSFSFRAAVLALFTQYCLESRAVFRVIPNALHA